MRIRASVVSLAVVLTLLCASTAMAICTLDGVITAQETFDPAGPAWQYTLTVTWDTVNGYPLSHILLKVDSLTGACTCAELQSALSFTNPLGSSVGDPAPCLLDYDGMWVCEQDPITGLLGKFLVLTPVETMDCSSPSSGVATFVFYSDLPPAPIGMDGIYLADAHNLMACWGELSGLFPSIPCGPTPTYDSSWGAVKGLFR